MRLISVLPAYRLASNDNGPWLPAEPWQCVKCGKLGHEAWCPWKTKETS